MELRDGWMDAAAVMANGRNYRILTRGDDEDVNLPGFTGTSLLILREGGMAAILTVWDGHPDDAAARAIVAGRAWVTEDAHRSP